MTVDEALQTSGIERLDAEILLASILKIDRAGLMIDGKKQLATEQLADWQRLIDRRKKGEPVAYILGYKEFYGRRFIVDRSTLIPRPSTERLVEQVLKLIDNGIEETIEADTGIAIVTKWFNQKFQTSKPANPFDKLRASQQTITPLSIVDAGCGSGCIGISLACEFPQSRIIMIDISSKAIDIAKQNAINLQVNNPIRWIIGDASAVIASIDEPFILVSNPPYIPNNQSLMRDVQDFEPHNALFAGEDGLAMNRPMLEAARKNPICTGVALEYKMEQCNAIQSHLTASASDKGQPGHSLDIL